MARTSAIVAVLGGSKSFPAKIRTWLDLHRSIEQGLRYRAVDALHSRYGLAIYEITFLLAVPSRTLARRKVEGRFRPEESDRLVRLGRIGALAEETLGDSNKASSWLRRPNRALANETPLRQLDTDIGSRQVENLLLRIAHGVYS
jgi:putative toxin-antitoxin system antitoxin component (TIGR02293 family)